MLLIKSLVEALTGREFKLFNMKLQEPGQVAAQMQVMEHGKHRRSTRRTKGFAIDYPRGADEERKRFLSARQASFAPADGRRDRIRAELDMARSYREESSFSAASAHWREKTRSIPGITPRQAATLLITLSRSTSTATVNATTSAC